MKEIRVRHLGAESFFIENQCEAGIEYMYLACFILRYILQQFDLAGQIRTYRSSKLGNVAVINVDIHEFMDILTKTQTNKIIENLLQMELKKHNESGDFDCMVRKGIEIPIIYSYFGKVHR